MTVWKRSNRDHLLFRVEVEDSVAYYKPVVVPNRKHEQACLICVTPSACTHTYGPSLKDTNQPLEDTLTARLLPVVPNEALRDQGSSSGQLKQELKG